MAVVLRVTFVAVVLEIDWLAVRPQQLSGMVTEQLPAIIGLFADRYAGVLEPDELDHLRIMDICRPYLGTVTGAYTDWTPLEDRGVLFPEDVDLDDPWQFRNVRVV